LTYEADLQAMPQVPTSAYDTILCCEVLEHLERPEAALRELHRVLRPTGRLILSVPFLSRLHEEPHDYFRFTEYGLRELFRRSGFEIMELTPTGGLFSFIGHQFSSLLILPTLHVPIVGEVVLALNFLLVVLPSRALDRMSRSARKFPAGYVAVVRS
jgi:SAM-dependent methyltransferase